MSKDYEVGYGKPPADHQFKPGQSGNPRGRPRGAKGFKTEMKAALEARVQLNSTGRKRSISTQAAAIRRLVERAVGKGDLRALEKLLGYAQMIESQLATEPAAPDPLDEALIQDFLARRGDES